MGIETNADVTAQIWSSGVPRFTGNCVFEKDLIDTLWLVFAPLRRFRGRNGLVERYLQNALQAENS